jgi:hypothetical protein
MKKFIDGFTMILLILGLTFGMFYYFYLYVKAWDIPMTKLGSIVYFWKAYALIWISVLFLYFKFTKK